MTAARDPCHPTSDREFAVWENGRRQGHHEARRQPLDHATAELIADALLRCYDMRILGGDTFVDNGPERDDLVAAILAAAAQR